jgi:hypothetical protein
MDKNRSLNENDYLKRVYSEEALNILSKDITFKDFKICFEEAKSIAPIFAESAHDIFSTPINECLVLCQHSSSLEIADTYFRLFYRFQEMEDDVSNKLGYEMLAAYYAEDFFLRWYSYFDKISHILNYALGKPFITKGRKGCDFKKIVKKIEEYYEKGVFIGEHLEYFISLKNGPVFRTIEDLRQDLAHRFLTSASLCGDVCYGTEVEDVTASEAFGESGSYAQTRIYEILGLRGGEKIKKTTIMPGPPERPGLTKTPYDLGEVFTIIDGATDILVDIKKKFIEWSRPEDIGPNRITRNYR